MKAKITLFFFYLLLYFADANAQSNLNNGDFEKWRLREFKCCGRNIDALIYWGMSEQITGLNYNKFVFRETNGSIVHSGISCTMLFSDTTYLNNLVLAPGIIAYGAMSDSASSAVTVGPVVRSTGMPLPINSNPVSLSFFMQASHAVTDTPYYMYVFTKWNHLTQSEDTLAYNRVDIPDVVENMDQWVQYTDSIHYTGHEVADTVRILFFGGRFGNPDLQGNTTWLDDVTLYYPATGVVSLDGKPVLQIFPDPVSDLLTVTTGQYKAGNSFKIFDVEGRMIKAMAVEAETTLMDISGLAQGNYLYQLQDKNNTKLNDGKFVVVR